uniref:Uncharacterized protein n=1 Tax=Panagrellus redivivus TaxID=6233 RepID=A0A7E4V227_PANRE
MSIPAKGRKQPKSQGKERKQSASMCTEENEERGETESSTTTAGDNDTRRLPVACCAIRRSPAITDHQENEGCYGASYVRRGRTEEPAIGREPVSTLTFHRSFDFAYFLLFSQAYPPTNQPQSIECFTLKRGFAKLPPVVPCRLPGKSRPYRDK